MTRRAFGPLLTAAVVWLTPCAAAAQSAIDPFIGRTVAEVRVTLGSAAEPDPALRSLVQIRAGAPLDVVDVLATVENLGRLPRFEDVRVTAAAGPSGVVVTVVLEPRHPINRIEFRGETGLTPAELERRVRGQFGGLPPASANLRSIEQTVERYLTDEGFLGARAEAETITTRDSDRATLAIDVVAGPRALLGEIEIVNRSPLETRRLVTRANLVRGQPYRPRALSTSIAALRDELRALGHYSAQITTEPTIDGATVNMRVIVEAGPLIRIAWAGDPRPDGDEDALVPIRREGTVDEDLLEDADASIRAALRRQGYRDAEVTHSRTENDGELVITFHVRRGTRYRIAAIDIPPGLHLPPATIRRELDLDAGDPLDEARVVAGLGRVVQEYHRAGFYQVSAAPEYQPVPDRSTPDESWVVLHPAITEGPLGRVAEVRFTFGGDRPVVPESDLRAVMRLGPGEAFSVTAAYRDRIDLETLYANRGFRSATVEMLEPEFSEDGTAVTLTIRVDEGPQTFVGAITVVGNARVSERAILEQITLREGAPLGRADVVESQRRLAELGIIRATVSEQPRLPGENVAHLIISVDEAPATTIGFGGGVEVETRTVSVAGGGVDDRLEFAPRGFFEIGRRNIGGRNRSLNLFTRVSLKRSNREAEEGEPDPPGRFGFTEYRAALTYRERRAFRTDADLLLGLTSEQGSRTNFNFVRRAANAEALRRMTPAVSVIGRYALEFTELFDEIIPSEDQLLIDRLFPQVRLSLVSTGVLWDRRDNPIAPTRGFMVSADLESAMRAIGSEVGYVKAFFQGAQFASIGGNTRHVLATRVQLGLARGFPRPIGEPDNPPPPPVVIDPDTVVADLPASQRFFAGGSTTVRGFQLDRLGVPEILNSDGLSNGGNAVVVVNAELRSRVTTLFGRSLAVVGFVDSGNVFARAADVDLGRLRGTAGFGVRYDSPLGPLRLDLGFKMSRLTFARGRERGWELHLSIGEAF